MLTIKHINTEGVERIFEAETVEVVNRHDRFADGIYFDWRMPPCRPLDALSADALMGSDRPAPKEVIHFAFERAAGDTDPVVYVMNRFGATVATYRL